MAKVPGKIPASKPRNPVVRNMSRTGTQVHKDKKRAAKQGDEKHRGRKDYSEHLLRLLSNQLLENQMLDDDLVNRGLDTWQIRTDDQKLIGDDIRVILKNVIVRTDLDAFNSGKKVFAYLRGTRIKDLPNFEGMQSYKLGYRRNLDSPFFIVGTNDPFITSDFVVFGMDGSVTAYIK